MTESPLEPGGPPVIDPTVNVLNLVNAQVKRQDDLREAENRLHEAENRHVRESIELRATHAKELSIAETSRIDAIRAVDVGAVNRAAEVATTQANTLAAQVATSAEAMRTQVAAVATAQTGTLSAALVPLQEAIADLRRAQYEAQGQKTQIIDTRSDSQAHSSAAGLVVAIIIGASTVLLGIIGLIITLLLRSPG